MTAFFDRKTVLMLNCPSSIIIVPDDHVLAAGNHSTPSLTKLQNIEGCRKHVTSIRMERI